MKSQRVIERRNPSAPATCTRMLGNWLVGYHCGAELRLLVTPSPISSLPYGELIVTKCLAGHIESGYGVLQEGTYA